MNLEEFKQSMTSDAMSERDKLKAENEKLKTQLAKAQIDYAKDIEAYRHDFKALTNRCHTQNGDFLCCFCSLHHNCDHRLRDDELIKRLEALERLGI